MTTIAPTPLAEPMLPVPGPSGAATWAGACLLPEWAGIAIDGPDAASFLHGQISQDVLGLDAHSARLGAYCSAKGRVLATALLLRPQPEQVWLWLDASLHATTLKRLSMFVLRAKARLSDLSPHTVAVGLVGHAADAAWAAHAHAAPHLAAPAPVDSAPTTPLVSTTAPGWPAAPLPCTPVGSDEHGMLVRLPAVLGQARALWLGPASQASALVDRWGPLPATVWPWLEVMSGIARVEARTTDQWVPQMINLEAVGGVNFKKGCYPGQEVVARSQYRGTIKRRLSLVHADVELSPGQEIFVAQDPGQPCGMVVNVAANPSGGWSALVELKLQHLGDLGQALPTPLRLADLPYTLDKDDV